jgi:DNA polymerase-3 subunit beta
VKKEIIMEPATIPATAFIQALRRCATLAEHRNTIPILANALIVSDGATVTVTVTDLETTIEETVPGVSGAAISLTLPVRGLLAVIDLDDAETVNFSVPDPEYALVRRGDLNIKMLTQPPSDFPHQPWGDTEHTMALSRTALLDALRRVRNAVSTEETRYYLNGVYLHPIDGGVALEATDGHRLHMETIPGETGPKSISRIIHRKTINTLVGLLEQSDVDPVFDFQKDSLRARVRLGDTLITYKAIDGNFPDIVRVVPPEDRVVGTMRMNSADLLRVAVQMGGFPGERSAPMALILGPACHAVVKTSWGDSAEITLPATWDGKGGMEIGFQCRYIAQALENITGFVTLKVVAARNEPAILEYDDLPEWKAVLMPMTI